MTNSVPTRRSSDLAEVDGVADHHLATVGSFLARDQLEQGRCTRASGADHADDAARREREGQVFEEQLVAKGFRDILDLDDLAAKALRHLDDDLRLAGDALFLRLDELVEAFDTRLRFGLTRFRRLPDPLELVLDRLLATGVLARFLLETLALLFEIGRIIAFVDEIAAAIEFEDPVHDIVEEVAIVGDEDDVARIVDEMLFEPGDAFGVEMVGRFVEQQDRRLFEQQAGECDAALFTARQIFDARLARRTAARLHRDFALLEIGRANV